MYLKKGSDRCECFLTILQKTAQPSSPLSVTFKNALASQWRSLRVVGFGKALKGLKMSSSKTRRENTVRYIDEDTMVVDVRGGKGGGERVVCGRVGWEEFWEVRSKKRNRRRYR